MTDKIEANRETVNRLANETKAMKKIRIEYVATLRKLEKLEEPKSEYKDWHVYIEGHKAGIEYSTARLMGTANARTFKEACEKLSKVCEYNMNYWDFERLTFFGCRLFDNLHDAQKSFG